MAVAQQCAVPSGGVAPPTDVKVMALADHITPPQAQTAPDSDALKRLTGSGARIAAQGAFHGFETGVAYAPDRVFVFFTPKDHAGVLGGTAIPAPYDTLRALSGKRATELAPWHGIRGMFLQNGDHFQVIYATPDGQAAIAGSLWDASGHDVTREQIRSIPGAVPTVRMDAGQITQAALTGLHGGEIGSANAPEVVMLIDPQCMYSIRAGHSLMTAVQAGQLRLKIVPLSLLDYEDHGESTINAKAMLSFPENEMASAWLNGRLNARADTPADTATKFLADNAAFAKGVDLKGTPTFLWIRRDGSLGRYEGNPRDIAAFLAEVGR
nr:thiol:disulfide interchange protein [Acetobacter sacchari]